MMKKRIVKIISFICIIVTLISFQSISVFAEETYDYSDYAQAIYLYRCDLKKELYSFGEDKTLAVGPTAKIMTGLIACESLRDKLDHTIVISNEMLDGISGNIMGLKSGMSVTVKDLIYGTVCGGNNDAAQVLAITIGGSLEGFVKKMNSYANTLYMNDTQYSNPTGLDDLPSKTTIKDTLKLAIAASQNSLYTEISSCAMYKPTIEGFTVYNRNALISQFSAQGYTNKNARGLIAGSTESGGFSLVASIIKEDVSYICIVMGAEADDEEIYSYFIANDLLSSIPYEYTSKKVLNSNDVIGKLSVDLAITDKNGAYISYGIPEDVYAYLPKNADMSKISYKPYFHNDTLVAPIAEGDCIGGVDIYYDNELVASSPLISLKSIEKNYILSLLFDMKQFFAGRFFIIFLIAFIPSLTFYLCFLSVRSRRKKVSKVKYKRFY